MASSVASQAGDERGPDAPDDSQRSGTQAVERTMLILREVANRGHLGWHLTDLAARCRLSKTTTHRLLTCLVRERMVRQRAEDHCYMPGPMLFELGLAALPERGELQYTARNRLAALARQTSAVALLFFRGGDDLVCAVRVGTARLEARALAILPGTRKPLVVATGGVAMLMAMPAVEARLTIARNFDDLGDYTPAEIAGIRAMLDRSFTAGMAISEGDVIHGVNAVGAPLCDRQGAVFAAIALAGPARRLPAARLGEFHATLRALAAELEAVAQG